jgi:hypothetical protein
MLSLFYTLHSSLQDTLGLLSLLVFISRCLVAVSNVGRSLSSGFQKGLPPSATASNQLQLLTCHVYNISARTAQKVPFLCYCYGPLPSNGRYSSFRGHCLAMSPHAIMLCIISFINGSTALCWALASTSVS